MERISEDRIAVAALKPFWRWAVLPDSIRDDGQPARPFYRRSTAEAFCDEWEAKFPISPVGLYRKCWFRRIERVR